MRRKSLLNIKSCFVILSGGHPTKTAVDRLSATVIGVLVDVLVFPIWAGEQLHRELIAGFDAVADSLEGDQHRVHGSELPELEKAVKDELLDAPPLSILNSASNLDSLAPRSLRTPFQLQIQDATFYAAELLRSLGKDIGSMKLSLQASLLKEVHCSAEKLQRTIYTHSYLLFAPGHISSCPGSPPLPEGPEDLIDAKTPDGSDMCYEMMRKQHRKLQWWPFGQVAGFEEDAAVDSPVPRMKTLGITNAASLAAFTSLLIESVARLDGSVDAVNKLGMSAEFMTDRKKSRNDIRTGLVHSDP